MSSVKILIGNSCSGKSTYAEAYCHANPNFIRINADKARFILSGDESNQEVSNLAFKNLAFTAEYLLSMGYSIIVDNLNYHKKARRQWIDLGKKYLCSIEAVIFDTPYEVCLERNENRDRKVPAFVFERVRDRWELPSLEEGFDNIVRLPYIPEDVETV